MAVLHAPVLWERPTDVEKAASLLKLLGHPSRLAIVARLHEGETTVAQMEVELDLHQPSLSQQLAELRSAGIVEARRRAKTVHYKLVDNGAAAVVDLLDSLSGSKAKPAPLPIAIRTDAASRAPIGAAVFAKVGPFHRGGPTAATEA